MPRALSSHLKSVPPNDQSVTAVSAIQDTPATELTAKVRRLLCRLKLDLAQWLQAEPGRISMANLRSLGLVLVSGNRTSITGRIMISQSGVQ